jgi:hypothetical protein
MSALYAESSAVLRWLLGHDNADALGLSSPPDLRRER